MACGVCFTAGAAYFVLIRDNNPPCDDEPTNIKVALAIYTTFFILFCNFFYQRYFFKRVVKAE